MKLFFKNCVEFALDLPTRIVYTCRYWEYVDYRVQLAFYILTILLMVGVLAVAQGKLW